jgi:catechol 2,3-dioxygenase-like lactoylglutathione lyase family enzyme
MALGKIEQILLNVKNIEERRQFYGELLGYDFGPVSTSVLSDGTEMKWSVARQFGLELIEQTKPRLDIENVRSICIGVKDMDKAKAWFAKKGVRLVVDIEAPELWNMKEAVYDVGGGYRMILKSHGAYEGTSDWWQRSGIL